MLALYTATLLKVLYYSILVWSIHFFWWVLWDFFIQKVILSGEDTVVFLNFESLCVYVFSCFIAAAGFFNVVLHSNNESSHPWLVLDLREKTLNLSSLSMMLLAVIIFWRCTLRKCFFSPGFLRVFIRNGCWILLYVPIWRIIGLFSLHWLIFKCQTSVTSLR